MQYINTKARSRAHTYKSSPQFQIYKLNTVCAKIHPQKYTTSLTHNNKFAFKIVYSLAFFCTRTVFACLWRRGGDDNTHTHRMCLLNYACLTQQHTHTHVNARGMCVVCYYATREFAAKLIYVHIFQGKFSIQIYILCVCDEIFVACVCVCRLKPQTHKSYT